MKAVCQDQDLVLKASSNYLSSFIERKDNAEEDDLKPLKNNP